MIFLKSKYFREIYSYILLIEIQLYIDFNEKKT